MNSVLSSQKDWILRYIETFLYLFTLATQSVHGSGFGNLVATDSRVGLFRLDMSDILTTIRALCKCVLNI